MSPIALEIIIALVGVLLSVSSASFVSGLRWGRVEAKIQSINERLSNIEKLFEMRLKGRRG